MRYLILLERNLQHKLTFYVLEIFGVDCMNRVEIWLYRVTHTPEI